MSDSLPERPDLDQLRRRAKELRDAARERHAAALERFARHHPSARPDTVSLAAAQLVIARELGFSSWPRLKAAVDAEDDFRRDVSAFVDASVEGRSRQASDIFRADPSIANRSLLAAAVLGDAEVVRAMLAVDPAAAVAIDEERGWPPLLYACYSRWHQIDPDRAPGLAEVVRILLDAGASPNTNATELRRSAEPQHEGMTEERREHPARRAVEQEGRHREDQQEMLDHVRAEQVVVREIVDRARQRPQQQGQPRSRSAHR